MLLLTNEDFPVGQRNGVTLETASRLVLVISANSLFDSFSAAFISLFLINVSGISNWKSIPSIGLGLYFSFLGAALTGPDFFID